MRRFGRKLDVDGAARRAAAHAVLLRLPATSTARALLDEPLARRARDALDRLAARQPLVIPRIVTADAAEAEAFLTRALARGHEGVMAKALDAPYAAGRRGSAG